MKKLTIALTNGRFGNCMYPLMVGITFANKYNFNNIIVNNHTEIPDLLKNDLKKYYIFTNSTDPLPPLNCFYTCDMDNDLSQFKNYRDLLLGGYLQNSNLINEDLCREIIKCPEIDGIIEKNYPSLENYIGLSIRRGDYVGHSIYQTLTKEFILRMIDKYYKEDKKFIITSDDIEWCKRNLNDLPGNIIFQDIKENKVLIDWFILTKTKSNILSCSSFSQSAGLLNPNKHCIVPYPYFKPESGVTWNDLLVPNFAIREPLYEEEN